MWGVDLFRTKRNFILPPLTKDYQTWGVAPPNQKQPFSTSYEDGELALPNQNQPSSTKMGSQLLRIKTDRLTPFTKHEELAPSESKPTFFHLSPDMGSSSSESKATFFYLLPNMRTSSSEPK